MPTLRIADDDALNAFATGLNDKQYSITVTRGLIDALDDAEIESVLGHELTHIRNGDVRMLVIAVVIAGVIASSANWCSASSSRTCSTSAAGAARATTSDKKGGAGIAIVIALALIALVWILSIVIRFALSRQREYLADSGSVELTKNPDAMISALRKIEGRGEIPGRQFRGDGNVHRQSARGLLEYFRHPSVGGQARRALVKFAGGHDPGPLAICKRARAAGPESKRHRRGGPLG